MVDGMTSRAVDLLDADAVNRIVEETGARYVVHAAGNTDVDDCEAHPDAAERLHVVATGIVAAAAQQAGSGFACISTDHLWDGTRPFVDEETPVAPMNSYARTKHQGELAARAAHEKALVLRTNFFGHGRPWRPSFSDWIESGLGQGKTLTMFDDVFFTPISLELLCPIIAEMATRGAAGIYHAAGSERISKYAFGVRLAEILGRDVDGIVPSSVEDASLKAPRPKDMSLATGKIEGFLGRPMPTCSESLEAHAAAAAALPADLHSARGTP